MHARIRLRRILPSLAAMLLCACSAAAPTAPAASAEPTPAKVEAAIAKAYAGLRGPRLDDPYEELFVDISYRRFGRSEGASAMSDYALKSLESPQPDKRLMARWGNAALPLDAPAIAGMERSNSNRGLLEAMFCKEQPIPADYATYARAAIAKGSYDLTHVLIGYAFAKEAGCAYPLPPEEVEAMVQATAAMLPGTGVTDLQLEAALVLAWAGRRDLLPSDLVERILASQWHNGGWAFNLRSQAADGHATMLAINLLLELSATPRGPVVAR